MVKNYMQRRFSFYQHKNERAYTNKHPPQSSSEPLGGVIILGMRKEEGFGRKQLLLKFDFYPV